MEQEQNKKGNFLRTYIIFTLIAFIINPTLGIIILGASIFFLFKIKRGKDNLSTIFTTFIKSQGSLITNLAKSNGMDLKEIVPTLPTTNIEASLFLPTPQISKLEKRKNYLQVALNSETIEEAINIANLLPKSERILIEAGTPLIKRYGTKIVRDLKNTSPGSYIVADTKCADLAQREVEMMANAGANAVTCLGVAPIETINMFILECKKNNVDSMIDMMNVESPQLVLKKIKQLPDVVVLHRGVDESEFSKEKQIPFYQIKQIKGNFDTLVSVAGGDSIIEIRRAIFNDADIVVVWKDFYQLAENTTDLAAEFLKEIK